MAQQRFQPGIETLLADRRRSALGRVGLLAHPASVDARGVHSSVRMRAAFGARLTTLFGPEHGYFGRGGAGEEIHHARHPAWDIPIHSLYGDYRKPTREMLADIDTLVFDLQDIGVRCYTFVSTLRLVMEACQEQGKRLVVADRPSPLASVIDGWLPDPGFESFVAGVPLPLVYGMTPGEAALYLADALKLDLPLTVADVRGWTRDAARGDWGPWISPSPGIRYWETAWPYPVTVIFEAFPHIDVGRGSTEPFQVFSAPWLKAEETAAALNALRLPGMRFHPSWRPDPGVRIHVASPARLRPFAALVHLVHTLQALHGAERLWGVKEARPEWFDKLVGTDQVRRALQAGLPPREIFAHVDPRMKAFRARRKAAVIYP